MITKRSAYNKADYWAKMYPNKKIKKGGKDRTSPYWFLLKTKREPQKTFINGKMTIYSSQLP